jgi:hypothetical protein
VGEDAARGVRSLVRGQAAQVRLDSLRGQLSLR